MRIKPARRIRGQIVMPGDKSVSHRAAVLAAIARGESRLSNFSSGEDCASTLRCLAELGVVIRRSGVDVHITGAPGSLQAPRSHLDCGNSGTTMRLLSGVLAATDFTSTLTGDSSLRRRPMKRIVEPLMLMGAQIFSDDGRPPLRIEGRRGLHAISYRMPVASAQVKSCILFAALAANGCTTVVEPQTTRDHTERMLGCFGVAVERHAKSAAGGAATVISLEGPAQPVACSGTVPGDMSSAAFFVAAAAMLPGSRLEIRDVGLNPTRAAFLPIVNALGADVRAEAGDEGGCARFNEPAGNIVVQGAVSLVPAEANASMVICGGVIPQVIDELPLLAVLGTQVSGGLSIRDAAELRHKESDRISTTVANLRAMGAEVEEYHDGLAVGGPVRLRGARIDAHGDHRIAMAFSIAALAASGESEIAGAECVNISFPEFFQLLGSIAER